MIELFIATSMRTSNHTQVIELFIATAMRTSNHTQVIELFIATASDRNPDDKTLHSHHYENLKL
jgi:hypothetical protein